MLRFCPNSPVWRFALESAQLADFKRFSANYCFFDN
ncbi:MAG: hypothetical protein BECKG1743D_GA0114223_105452 [Candidatus Kentron sp. G]|nr:MAG: hypothetical protein BECKG1743F_GA0114225_104502 [Candidatus Kentron sp. G]VFN04088.1 MAG: hypothetical protein BECKG1743D_GA0114223_105452 [Candidatus Kentron sp. G]